MDAVHGPYVVIVRDRNFTQAIGPFATREELQRFEAIWEAEKDSEGMDFEITTLRNPAAFKRYMSF